MNRKFYKNIILGVVVLIMGGALFYQHKKVNNLEIKLDNSYNRAFYDMLGYVENIKTIMTKASVCTNCIKTSNLLEEIWHKANMAQENLNMIPVSGSTLKNTSKYLNQVGDFAYSLNKQSLKKDSFTKKQYDTLQKLQTYSEVLLSSLKKLERDVNGGKVRFSKQMKNINKTLPNGNHLREVEKNFQDYPTLIYDGPFSDHINKIKPKGLIGKKISEEEAKNIVKKFLEDRNIARITKIGETSGVIKTYNFEAKIKNNMTYIDVTKKGGHIYSMMCNRVVPFEKINMDKAKNIASEFLKKNGYKNMKDTYYLKEDNTALINYSACYNDVICYPDLIKVKIALDNGEVVGFESRGYITSHTKRDIPKFKINLEDAKKMINQDVKILSSGKAIIPTDLKTEVLTYEFKGKLNDKDFLVYVNSETGEVENILMIIDTPNGVLTM